MFPFRRTIRICFAGLLAGGYRLPAEPGDQPPFERVKNDGNHKGLWKHAGSYGRFRVRWRMDGRVAGARAVFPHPLLPDRVWITTDQGLVRSGDGGLTWQPLPAAGPIGEIRHITFHPTSPATLYLASGERGIWLTTDGGDTFSQVAERATGLAADEGVQICLYPADRRALTLIAAHGELTPGISVSEDGGASWRVLAKRYYVHHVLPNADGGMGLFFVASKVEIPEVRSIYACHSLEEPWYEVVRDIFPLDLAQSKLKGPVYVATAASGLLRLASDGTATRPVGPPGISSWASVGVTWGAHADQELVYAYDPTGLGMLVSSDGMRTSSAHSRGLITGPLIGEGARIRANANGTVFFGVANGLLCRGTRAGRAPRVTISPPVLTFAGQEHHRALERLRKALRPIAYSKSVAGPAAGLVRHARTVGLAMSAPEFEIRAEIDAGPYRSVTVDLSRFGGSPRAAMSADPNGKPGVYTTTVPFSPQALQPDARDWRRTWPGLLALSVTCVAADGALVGGVGVVAVADRPESFLWRSDFRWWEPSYPEGIVSIEGTDESVQGSGVWTAVKLVVGPGPWSFPIGSPYSTRDVTGYYALGFWFRSDDPGGSPFSVQVRDNPAFVYPTTSEPVSPLEQGRPENPASTTGFRQVVIPMKRLLRGSPALQTRLLGFVVFSGNAAGETTYWIDDLRFYLTREDMVQQTRRMLDE